MSIINYHDPTVINFNLDDNGQPVSIPIVNETKQVVDGKIPLEGLPDEQYRIQITGYVEINVKDRIDSPEKFKCDYTHGVLYFDQSLNGKVINIDKYYSRGQFYISSSRVWTKLSDTGEVLETFDNAVGRINEVYDAVTNLDNAIDGANTVKSNLDNSISTGNTAKSNLDTSIDSANTINGTLSNSTTGTIKKATDINTTLSNTISTAKSTNTTLSQTDTQAQTTKSNLDSSISTGNTLKTNLDSNISTGTTLKNNLDTNISEGNQLKIDLPPIINNANTSKTNLETTIGNANSSKINLDNSIDKATTKKTGLDASVTNAEIINDTLSNVTTGTIKKATDINTTLNSSIDTANTSKTNLDTSINNSTTTKSDLDGSISIANTTKTALDGSITEGNALKSDLDTIIAGTDYEQMITDVNNLKTDQHNHANKSTLDGLSDVDGKLKYNGQDVGIGDMTKAKYDTDGDGKVDIANNAEKLGGQLPSYYAKQTDIPDISGKADKIYINTELGKKIDATEKGSANGVAELDFGGKVPSSQLPSYVDDVLEFSNLSIFPTTGETGKIYVAIDTNLTYRWSGTAYVEISPSIALGETSSTAYRGDRGKTAYDHSQSTHARIDATKVESSTINGNVKINGTEVNVYTHPANHDDRYYTETEVDNKLANKVDNSRVLTDVPLNAKFTDTVTPINDTLTSTSTTQALSANQGKILDDKINNLTTDVETHKADFMQLKNKLPVATGRYIATNDDTRIINIGFIPVFIVIYQYVASNEEYQYIAHFDKEDSGYYRYTGFSHLRKGSGDVLNPHNTALQYSLLGRTENGSTGFIFTASQEGNIIKYFAFGDVREVIK